MGQSTAAISFAAVRPICFPREMLWEIARWTIVAVGIFLIGGTSLSFSHSSHELIRIWDFPRIQIALVLAPCLLGAWWLLQGWGLALFLFFGLAAFLWHLWGILLYTPIYPKQVLSAQNPPPERSFRLVTTNVLMQNRQYERWLQVVRAADPDLILAAEVNAGWEKALEPLRADYPHVMSYPQDNMYGLMLFSRLELLDPRIRFLVQNDIPSFHVKVRLADGSTFRLRGIHPRPPEPVDDQDSGPRDAELVLVGREIAEADEPTVVAGDLNDVAWSHTTRLFQRISRTLDPRVGRTLCNSFHAEHWYMRWPLDHVFHTRHFGLIQIRRLPYVGSDHFPILVDLTLNPPEAPAQRPPGSRNGDEDEADDMVEREAKDD